MITLENFPNDGDEWYVLRYGDILPNQRTTPSLIVTLRNKRTDSKINTLIPATAIAHIRLGSIWKGQEPTNRYYKDYSKKPFVKKKFSFNLHQIPPETVIICKTNNGEKEIYPISIDDNISQIQNRIGGAYVRLRTDDGITVYISTMELFASTYAPFFPTLQEEIMSKPIDRIIDKYVRECKQNDKEYFIRPYHSHRNEVIAMLTYLACNKISEGRASTIFQSLQKHYGHDTEYGKASILLALPYHPTVFEFEGSGFWEDEKTVYIQRIDVPYIPNDFIINYTPITWERGDDEKDGRRNTPLNHDETSRTVRLQNEFNPSRLQKMKKSKIDISPSADNAVIRQLEAEVYQNTTRYLPKKEIEEPKNTSTGHADNRRESEDTARLRGQNDIKKQEKIHDEALLKRIIDALDKLSIEKQIKYAFVDGDRNLLDHPVLFSPYDSNTVGQEGLYLIRVTNPSGAVRYLLETDRRYPTASYIGISFGDVTIDEDLKNNIVRFMAQNNHHLTRKNNKRGSIKDFPVPGYQTLRHPSDDEALLQTLTQHLIEP